jgi:antitoxin HicB
MDKHINPKIETSVGNALEEEGIFSEVGRATAKQVIACQILQEMVGKGLNKSQMASKMDTSRPSLERLLDSENESVTLKTMIRAATVLGKSIRLELVDMEESNIEAICPNTIVSPAISMHPAVVKKPKSNSCKSSPYKPSADDSEEIRWLNLDYFKSHCGRQDRWCKSVYSAFGYRLSPEQQRRPFDIDLETYGLRYSLLNDWCEDIWAEFQNDLPQHIRQQAIDDAIIDDFTSQTLQ